MHKLQISHIGSSGSLSSIPNSALPENVCAQNVCVGSEFAREFATVAITIAERAKRVFLTFIM